MSQWNYCNYIYKNHTTPKHFKQNFSQTLLLIPVEYSLRNSYTTLDTEIMVALIMCGEPAIPATTNSRNDVRHSSTSKEGQKVTCETTTTSTIRIVDGCQIDTAHRSKSICIVCGVSSFIIQLQFVEYN